MSSSSTSEKQIRDAFGSIGELADALEQAAGEGSKPDMPLLSDPLSAAEHAQLAAVLEGALEDDDVVAGKDEGLQVSCAQFRRLVPSLLPNSRILASSTAWLDDATVNRLALLAVQAASAAKGQPRVEALTSFFYERLTRPSFDAARVARWARRIKLAQCDYVLCPVNLNNYHWVMCILAPKSRRVACLNSQETADKRPLLAVGAALHRFLVIELDGDKDEDDNDASDAYTECDRVFLPVMPFQTDASSCGVFSSLFGIWAALGLPLARFPTDLVVARQRLGLALLQNRLPFEADIVGAVQADEWLFA
eukprot:m.83223 g.83223  ORF g.83223 m.83223 type:complete len:308 (-) comp8295_c0_seq1:2264-3187(-)